MNHCFDSGLICSMSFFFLHYSCFVSCFAAPCHVTCISYSAQRWFVCFVFCLFQVGSMLIWFLLCFGRLQAPGLTVLLQLQSSPFCSFYYLPSLLLHFCSPQILVFFREFY